MRHLYLVTYDITDDKRLRKVFKKMNGFGDHTQYSVFRCELSKKERVLMVGALGKIINQKEDQVLIIDLGPATAQSDGRIESLGRAYKAPERKAVVV